MNGGDTRGGGATGCSSPVADRPALVTTTSGPHPSHNASDDRAVALTSSAPALRALLEECDSMAGAASSKVGAQLRPLTAADFREAQAEVTPSVLSDSAVMAELRQWNQSFGEGAQRDAWNPKLSYFM